jgi:thiol-disulfide isomerase/thioredoxin
MSVVDSIVGFVQANPFLIIAILFFVYNKWKSSQPWPDFGGCLTKVHNCQEWDELLKRPDRLVVIDAYALWCPPCKQAAPVYAKLSEEFTPETCCFAKVDVDEARDVSQRLGIQAMPTFKARSGRPCHPAIVCSGSSAMHLRSRSP